MKNFNIMGVHLKIRIHPPCIKKQFWGGRGQVNHLKRGAWIVCRFRRGLEKKEKGRVHVFEVEEGGGVVTMSWRSLLIYTNIQSK